MMAWGDNEGDCSGQVLQEAMEAADEMCVFEKLIVAQHEYVTGNDTIWEDGEALRRSTRSTLDMSDID
jgi:hypothetical protein